MSVFVVYRWNDEGFPAAIYQTSSMEIAESVTETYRDAYPDLCFYWVPEN